MKLLKLLLLLLMLMALSGCWDSHENERMFYIHGFGLDYKDGMYEVYIQLISFVNVAKTEEIKENAIQANVNSAKGKTPIEAIFNLYNSIDERVYWGHISFLLFTEDAFQKRHINSLLNMITRYIDTRYNIYIFCTEDPLEEILLVPTLLDSSITLTAMGDPSNAYKQESYVAPITLRNLIIDLNEPNHVARVPLIGINKDWESKEGAMESLKLKGFGIVSDKEFLGFIEGKKADGFQWMSNETLRSDITTSLPSDESEYISIVLYKYHVKINPIISHSNVQFDIIIEANAHLSTFSETASAKIVKESVQKQITEDIMTTYNEGLKMGTDVYRLSEQLYRKENKTWKQQQQDGAIELTEDSIRNIDIYIKKVVSGRKSFKNTID